MPFDLAALAFKEVSKLVTDAVKKRVEYESEGFFTKRRIENELEKSVLRVIEPLEAFLNNEKISESQQRLLIEMCMSELRPLIEDPSRIFEGSLDGQKVVDQLYVKRPPPAAIQEENLTNTYFLLLPRIANLICSFPPAIKAWQIDGYREGFKKLDQITDVLRTLTVKVDSIGKHVVSDEDNRILGIRHTLLQLAKFKMELAGLRPDRLIEPGNVEDFFVLPALNRDLTSGAVLTVQTSSQLLDAFLSHNRRELISGPPGSGKTTLAIWLQVQQLSKPDPHVAIVVPLRDLRNDKLPSLVELVRESVGRHRADEIEPKDVIRWRDEGRITIICDGFDEISPSHRDSVVDWLNELEAAAELNSVLVTSRPLSTEHLQRLTNFTNRWQILPFDEPRVVEYIHRWYEKSTLLRGDTHPPAASDLARTWRSDPTVGPLTGNPLVLTTLLMVHHLDGNLPKSRARLYERYIEGMLGSWDDKRKVSEIGIEISRVAKHRILTGIALHFHLQEVDILDEDQLLRLVDKVAKDNAIDHSAVDLLQVLRERTGLLIGPGSYSFVHKSVAEFLVAQAVIQGDQRDESGERIDRMRVFRERDDDRWNTVLFFWAGLTGIADFEDLVDSALEVPGDSTFELVFGLLYDQIERLPVEWTRSVVIKLLKLGFASSQSCALPDWLPPGTGTNDTIDFLPYPRSIATVSPDHALYALISACKLSWKDLAESHPSTRPAIWLAIVANTEDLNSWRRALCVDPNEVPLPPNYYFFPLWGISKMISGESPESEIYSAVGLYQSAIPSRAGIIPLYLISAFIDEMDSDPRRTDLPRLLTRLLDQVVRQIGNAVDQEWLIESRRMTRVRVDFDDHDILTRFSELLEDSIRNRFVSETADIANVRNWVLELKLTRDALLNAQSEILILGCAVSP